MGTECVAITGASGLLGREIVGELASLYELRGLDIAVGRSNQSIRYADILNLDALRAAFDGCTAVIHGAGLQIGPAPEKIFATNAVGTWNVLQAASETGVRKVVLVSSECAVGVVSLANTPSVPRYLPIDLDHPLLPADAYGVSKQTSEAIARAFSGRSMQVVTLRPVSIYVAGMESLLRQSQGEDDPYMWLYVEGRDVARAVRLALEYDGPNYDCFFISAPDTFSAEETLALVRRRYGKLPEIRRPDVYSRNPHATIYDISRTRDLLGFEPVTNWRQFLERETLAVARPSGWGRG
ncbi:MAG TPA: NAD(P)-dependent oxidoreductase [Aestuariivirgaceae bacterium]|nr:NAD(P)-dependent oxidoreductase [Aestuariivirgaceae bacterium]